MHQLRIRFISTDLGQLAGVRIHAADRWGQCERIDHVADCARAAGVVAAFDQDCSVDVEVVLLVETLMCILKQVQSAARIEQLAHALDPAGGEVLRFRARLARQSD